MDIRANSMASRDKAYFLHPMTNLRKHQDIGPRVITHAKGIYVYDEDGNEYIEGMAGLWCTALGFGNERLIEAAKAQLDKLPYYHSFAHRNTDVAIDLAEMLIGMAPVKMSKAFFTSSGSEANDTVLKIVRYFNNAIGRPEKKKIIARKKGYHGTTYAAASLTGLPYMHTLFDLPIQGVKHTETPHHYHNALPGESEEEFASRLAGMLEQMILAEGPETVAAFIAEPIMGAGGVIVPPKTYFPKIQAVLKKYDILMIADEVICGFGRTGNMFGSETCDVKPDIMVMAKALTSAYLPLGAILINEPVYQALEQGSSDVGTFGHGHTYGSHPVSVAVAVETLKIYEETKIVDHVRRVGARFQDKLRQYADHPLVGEVRGVGLIAAVELIKNKETRENFDPKAGIGLYCQARCEDHGLFQRSLAGDSVAFSPPLIVDEAEVDQIVERFGKGLEETWTMVKEQGLQNA